MPMTGGSPTSGSGTATSTTSDETSHDPTFALTDSTPVVCQWFRVVERLDTPT